jgi:hypothetical protein
LIGRFPRLYLSDPGKIRLELYASNRSASSSLRGALATKQSRSFLLLAFWIAARRFARRNDAEMPVPQLFHHNPRRRTIACTFHPPDLAIDAGLLQPQRQLRAEQKVIEPQTGIAFKPVSPVRPEPIERRVPMLRAQRVGPALLQQCSASGAALRLDQRVLVPGARLINVERRRRDVEVAGYPPSQ